MELALRESGITLVRCAVGDKYVMEELLTRGLSLGGEQSGHVILLEHGTTGDGVLTGGTTPLIRAAKAGDVAVIRLLLEKGANPNVEDLAGMAALYAAADMNSLQWVQGRPAPILRDRLDAVDLVKLLLAKGANPNQRLKRGPLKRHHDAGSTLGFGTGATPLMRAARTNDVSVMKALLDGGADPFLTLPDRTNALHIAAGLGYGGLRGEGIRIVVPTADGAVEALGLLLDRGMDVDAFNAAGNTALHGAVGRGDAVVKFLASPGAAAVTGQTYNIDGGQTMD